MNNYRNLTAAGRVEVVDAIRGIAVAMIILLHSIEHFNLYNQTPPDSVALQLADQMVWDSLWFVIGGKAYAIFALLFGFSFFILGMVAGRTEWFADRADNRRLWGRILAVALLAFFPLYGLSSLIPAFVKSMPAEALSESILYPLSYPTFLSSLMLVINSLHKFCFMTVIVTSLLFAFYTTPLHRPMQLIMPYGRMSLTNYITQSIIGASLFYHWGLHLQLCDTASVAAGICILIAQACFCRWWMNNHSHGPLEAIWKRLTWIKKTESNH